MTTCVLLAALVHAAAGSWLAARTPTVYSIGDLHGDFERFRAIVAGLGLAKFDEEGNATWTGGKTILVSTGDSVDRGDHSRPIYTAFRQLAQSANTAGGEVVNILGNHDLMNLQGDLRYVTEDENSPTGDYGGSKARELAWSPRGELGADIRSRFLAAAVRGDSLFVHAGLHPHWLSRFAGQGQDLVAALNDHVHQLLRPDRVSIEEPVFGDEGPFWTRSFAMEQEANVCSLLAQTLRLAGVKRMVVGHTIQDGGVRGRCLSEDHGYRLVLGDTAISRAYGPSGMASAVEYAPGGGVTAIYFDEQGRPRRDPMIHRDPFYAN